MDQLVLHLDKIPIYSGYRLKVLVRTAIGHKQPLDAGSQHTGDYVDALNSMLDTVEVWRLKDDPMRAYKEVYTLPESTIVVE